MKITGRLASIGEVKVFDSGFMLEEFYLDCTRYNQNTGEKYANFVKLQNANEKINLQFFDIGDMVDIEFSINGRFYANAEGEARHSQNLNTYKMEKVKSNSELPPMEEGVVFAY